LPCALNSTTLGTVLKKSKKVLAPVVAISSSSKISVDEIEPITGVSVLYSVFRYIGIGPSTAFVVLDKISARTAVTNEICLIFMNTPLVCLT
jgi:hypothetical protein